MEGLKTHRLGNDVCLFLSATQLSIIRHLLNSILQVFIGTCKVDFIENAAQKVYSQKFVMEVFLESVYFQKSTETSSILLISSFLRVDLTRLKIFDVATNSFFSNEKF